VPQAAAGWYGMTDAEMNRRAGVAIRMAFKCRSDDERGFEALQAYVAEIAAEADLNRLYAASEALGDAVMDVLAERSEPA
jgi:hypothetical protein